MMGLATLHAISIASQNGHAAYLLAKPQQAEFFFYEHLMVIFA